MTGLAEHTRTCSSPTCGASVIWAVTEANGKRMPVDAEPVARGNIELDFVERPGGIDEEFGERYPAHTVVVARYVDPNQIALFDARPPRYVSHFATCPDADRFRR